MSEVLEEDIKTHTKNTLTNKSLSLSREGVFNILEVDSDSIIFCDESGKKVAIITYKFDIVNGEKICYISFFWTQNGYHEDYQGLTMLDRDSISQKYISYKVMEEFIQKYCSPNSIKRIYLDTDVWKIYPGANLSKKEFWKQKMGTYLIQNNLIRTQYSQWTEICFVLKT